MTDKNDNTECADSHLRQNAEDRVRVNAEAASSADANSDSVFESGVIEELRRRWPGIVVLADKPLGDGLGVAVYFTFPGGKRMAVWVSGTNEVGLAAEDRKHWKAFIAEQEVPSPL